MFRPPRRYNVAFIRVAVSVDHRYLDAVDETDRIDAHFAVVVTIIGPLDSWSVENPRGVFKGDSMPVDVCDVLGGISNRIPDLYEMYLRLSRCEVLPRG